MTYIDYLNQFDRWLESNPLPGNAQLLYFKLLNVFNRAGWPEYVQVDNRRLEWMLDNAAETTVIRARDKLVEAGFIQFYKGKKGSPNKYALLDILSNNASISASESASENASISASKNDSKNASESASHIKTKTKNKKEVSSLRSDTSCAEPLKTDSAPPVVALPLNTGAEYAVTAEQCQEWAGLYPAVDVIQQLRAMRGWLLANPKNRKTQLGMPRFINNWLAKEQNRASRGQSFSTAIQAERRFFDE